MSLISISAFQVMAPAISGATGTSTTRIVQRLSGTSASSSIATQLERGCWATLLVSHDTEIGARFTAAASTAVVTDPEFGKNARFDYLVDDNSDNIAIISADASSAYEAWVWTSSP